MRTVAVDLDGVLAQYDGWKGDEHIGEPIPGAVAFVNKLSEFANVTVHTARMYTSHDLVRKWLDEHGFRYANVWAGNGKPIASAYVDDRAVSCIPENGNEKRSYDQVLRRCLSLCIGESREPTGKNILIMTVGLPRSGKSTWAATQNAPVVNPDSIRLAIHGQPFISSAEPYVWATAKTMVRSLFIAGHETVILDATNTTKARRDQWKSSQWERMFCVFDTDKDTCILRAHETGSTLEHIEGLIGAIERMNDEYEPLDSDELEEHDNSLHQSYPV